MTGAPLTSLARPSGNITGVFPQQIELAKKRLQIFKEALPNLQRMASRSSKQNFTHGLCCPSLHAHPCHHSIAR
jgi:hypothetical protein